MAQSANPAATLVSRSMVSEITPRPSGGIPPALPITTVVSYQIASGQLDLVQAGTAEAQDLHESLGAQVSVWAPLFAGTNSGTIAYLMGFEGWTARAQFGAKLTERNQGRPGPLARLIRSGALTIVSSSLSVPVEL